MSSLKQFTQISKLGQGSFGQVFKVKRNTDGKQYAMKKVKLFHMKQKQKQNAVNQVRILASLSDDFIIGYKDAFYDQPSQCLCVIMQFAGNLFQTDGGDILKKINENKRYGKFFAEKEIWKALYQMTAGLKSLHDKKILHRDLKCANVFITKEGDYKLGDLNVSKVLKKNHAQTQTGTPFYASPQIWKDQPYDGKSDMWSLGCVIYEMATNNPPFRANNLQELYRKVCIGIFDRIPPSRYSADLNIIVSMLLKVNPNDRPTANELLSNSILIKHTGVTFSDEIKQERQLLQTIKFNPHNLKALQSKLPKSNYQNKQQQPIQQKKIIKQEPNPIQQLKNSQIKPKENEKIIQKNIQQIEKENIILKNIIRNSNRERVMSAEGLRNRSKPSSIEKKPQNKQPQKKKYMLPPKKPSVPVLNYNYPNNYRPPLNMNKKISRQNSSQKRLFQQKPVYIERNKPIQQYRKLNDGRFQNIGNRIVNGYQRPSSVQPKHVYARPSWWG